MRITGFRLSVLGYIISGLLGLWLAAGLLGAAMTGSTHGWLHDFVVAYLVVGFVAFLIAWVFRTNWRISGALLCSPAALLFLLIAPGFALRAVPPLLLVILGGSWVGMKACKRMLERKAKQQT